jgi:hypothetical protein
MKPNRKRSRPSADGIIKLNLIRLIWMASVVGAFVLLAAKFWAAFRNDEEEDDSDE